MILERSVCRCCSVRVERSWSVPGLCMSSSIPRPALPLFNSLFYFIHSLPNQPSQKELDTFMRIHTKDPESIYTNAPMFPKQTTCAIRTVQYVCVSFARNKKSLLFPPFAVCIAGFANCSSVFEIDSSEQYVYTRHGRSSIQHRPVNGAGGALPSSV